MTDLGDLERISAIATDRHAVARVAVRVNPDIDARSHPHISTGLKTNKFGVALADARETCRRAAKLPGLEIVGLHIHVGSQITDLEPLRRAAAALVVLARELRDDGITIDHLDLGGGLGISYDGSPIPSFQDYAAALLPVVRDSGLSLVLEPGRSIVGPAGVLVGRVVDIKQSAGKLFIVLDAGRRIADGAPAAVQASPQVRAAYLGEGELQIKRREPADVAASATVLECESAPERLVAIP